MRAQGYCLHSVSDETSLPYSPSLVRKLYSETSGFGQVRSLWSSGQSMGTAEATPCRKAENAHGCQGGGQSTVCLSLTQVLQAHVQPASRNSLLQFEQKKTKGLEEALS